MGVLFGQAVKAVGSGSRLFEYMDLRPRLPNSGGKILDSLKGDIEFRNIFFKVNNFQSLMQSCRLIFNTCT
jgi:ABC-type multidrug transport system fused ATPase/permease subunit